MSLDHVLIQDAVMLYQSKAPYVPSGKSVFGAVEYDEANDMMKCHECGEVVSQLGRHVNHEHKMTSREYKAKHGLRKRTALCSETMRKKCSKANSTPKHIAEFRKRVQKASNSHQKGIKKSRSEVVNMRAHCAAQLLAGIVALAQKLGRTPAKRELAENNISPRSIVYTFGSIAQAQKLAGLKPNEQHNHGKRYYSDEQLLEYLRTLAARNGGSVSQSDIVRAHEISTGPYYTRWGSLTKAKQLAGVA